MNVATSQPTGKRAAARRTILTSIALVVVGGVMLAWIWRAATTATHDAALTRARIAVGVEVRDEALALEVRTMPLELPPGAAATRGTVLAASLGRHRVVLLNFWAAWCPPCITEMPSWLRLGAQSRALGVGLVAVSYDDDWPAIAAVFAAGATARLGEKQGTDVALPGGVDWARDPEGQAGDSNKMLRTRRSM